MKKLIEYLKKYANDDFLINNFNYSFSLNGDIFTKDEMNKINIGNNWFEKNVLLKIIVQSKIKNNPENNEDLFFWIIQEWGGIRSFKKNEKNANRIFNSLKNFKNNLLSNDEFSVISSLSKIVSFCDIDRYFIYDSRNIFIINWLILKMKIFPSIKFFPQPSGRNRIISNYNIESLVNFYYIVNENVTNFENLYYSSNEAFFKYIELLKNINTNVWEKEDKKKHPFYIEMLIFSLSTTKILNDIKESIKITLE